MTVDYSMAVYWQIDLLKRDIPKLRDLKREELLELGSEKAKWDNYYIGSRHEANEEIKRIQAQGKRLEAEHDKEIRDAQNRLKRLETIQKRLPSRAVDRLDEKLEKFSKESHIKIYPGPEVDFDREACKKIQEHLIETGEKAIEQEKEVQKRLERLEYEKEKEIQAEVEQDKKNQKLEQFRENAADILTPPPPGHEREPSPENDDDPPPKTPGRAALDVPDTTKAEEMEKEVQKRLERLRRAKELQQEKDQEIEW